MKSMRYLDPIILQEAKISYTTHNKMAIKIFES